MIDAPLTKNPSPELTPPTLQVRLLGPGKVLGVDRQQRQMRSRKQLGLLAYLAIEQSIPHSRDTLIALFWPENELATARNNLRVTLSRLRKLCRNVDNSAQEKREPLVINRYDAQWDSACSNWVDVNQFNQLLNETRLHQHMQRNSCELCQPKLRQATALYNGDLLDGFALDDCPIFEEWLFIQRERLHLLVLDAHADLAVFAQTNGELTTALDSVQRQIALDSLRESAYRQQMYIQAKLGERSRALAAFERCRSVLHEELGIDPEPETQTLYQQIVAGAFDGQQMVGAQSLAIEVETKVKNASDIAALGAKVGREKQRHNLPQQLTPLIGRTEELAQLQERFADPAYRLLSLVGPGGIGKSRLALQAAVQQIHTFADGVYFVPLTQIQSADAIAVAIAKTLGLAFGNAEKGPNEQLVEMLQRKHLLLILDNFEHLMDGVDLLTDLLQASPNIVLVVTSRERLNLQSEDLFVLKGLAVPQNSTEVSASNYAAVRLFVDRAHRLNKQFKLTDDVLPDVVRLCQILEGLPLGIELAATWIRDLSCAEIVEELGQGLDLLETPLNDVHPQHRSLRAVFDSSWNLLSKTEQETLATLTLFRGGFTPQSAKAVAGASLLALSQLSYKSLLYTSGSRRYDMHEMVRQFAAEKLLCQGNVSEAVGRHSDFFLHFVCQRAYALNGPEPQKPQAEIRVELDNVRAAWQVAVEHVAADGPLAAQETVDQLQKSTGSLADFYRMIGLAGEGAARFTQALALFEKMDVAPLRLQLLLAHSRLNIRMGKLEKATQSANEALMVGTALGDVRGQSQAQMLLGYAQMQGGHASEARSSLEEALALARQSEDRALEGIVLRRLGTVLMDLDERAVAKSHLLQALEISRARQNLNEEQAIVLYLGVSAAEENEFQEALEYLTLALDLVQRVGNRSLEARIQNAVGFVTAALGDLDAAMPFHQQSRQIAHDIVEPLQESHALHNLCTVERKRGNLPEAEAYGQEALRTARIDNLPEALAYAWLHLGYVWTEQKSIDEAILAFQESHKLWTVQERNTLAIEALAGLAEAHHLNQDDALAMRYTEEAVDFLDKQTLDGVDEPIQIYLSLYRVLIANDAPHSVNHSADFLQQACAHLSESAARIDDPLRRHQYFNNIPAHHILHELCCAKLDQQPKGTQ